MEDVPQLLPIQFFNISWQCPFNCSALSKKKTFLLPSTADLLGEDPFAQVYMAFSEEKISFLIEVQSEPDEKSSVELFFDTRDLKDKATVSRFCHHFIFTPIAKENHFGWEVTRFRNEEMHRLADPSDLMVTPICNSHSYMLTVEIPAYCLHGYEPASFRRLGFTYRIRRSNGPAQHFAVSSNEVQIEQHPALWATLELKAEKSK